MTINCRVPDRPELLELPKGTAVIDDAGTVWSVGGLDGSCVKLHGPRWGVARFYQQVRFVDGHWRFADDEGNVKRHDL